MGLLSLIGALYDQAGSDHSPSYLTRVSNQIHPDIAAGNMENQIQQSALAKMADMNQAGVNDPMQIVSGLSNISPEYAMKAAQIQAQNPLAMLLHPSSGGGAGGNISNLTGKALLDSLPPAIASQVKGISEGTQQLPQGMGGAANRQALLQLVNQYDPSFDAVNYNARAATRKDFTSGKSAQNITAMNTALGHLASLSDAYDKLGNTNYPIVNTIANAVENQFSPSNQAATTDVTAKAHAVSEELAKVFRSTGMAESDVKAWENQINTSSTPAQSKKIIEGAVDLLNSRLDALGQQYNQGMGTTKQGIELLSPHAQAAYAKLTGNPPAETSVSGNMAADNAAQDPVARAKAAGYSDAEIQSYLAKRRKK